ncbi:MAG: TolC family protein [Phycisphaerales bacterium]|nr:MAG: TolC family protein [Phycisphaerales bacterium]
MNSRPAHEKSRGILTRCGALCATLVLAGCVGPFARNDYLAFQAPPEQLHDIEAVRLEDRSRSDPVSVEDATEQVISKVVEPPEPPAKVTVSLEEVRAAALARNLDLAVELLSPAIAQASVDEEEAKFESTFFGDIRRSRSDSPTPTPLIAGSQTDFTSFDFGVSIPLRSGGQVIVDLPFSETDTNNPSAFLNPSYSTDLRFSVSQPLLRNGWQRTSTYSIRVMKHQKQIADARTKLEAIRVLANADKAYWRLYAAQRELVLRQQQYELSMTQLEQARRRVAAGDVAGIEVTRAESGVSQRLEAIIIAETLMRSRQRDLKRVMNRDDLPMNGPTAIELTTPPQPVGLDLDPEALADFALANRMEMLELELQLAIDASTVDFRRNAALPLVTLDYTYNINGLGLTYNDAFDQLPDHSFEDWSLGVRAEVPLGNEAAKAGVHRAILQRLQRLATKRQREVAIRQEVFEALDQFQQNWQRILAARQEAILNGRTYEAERRQFEVGQRTSTDVLDAAARLAEAQSREIQALADYQISQVDIAFATGTLLGHDRVRWEATDPADLEN